MVEENKPRQFRPGLETSTWPNLKHARAVALFRDFQGRIETWSAGQPFTTDKVISDDGLLASVILRVRQPPPIDEWAVIFGDAVHNLRSALDSLVWELAHFDGQVPRNPRALYFPVVTDSMKWPKAAEMLESCPNEAIERIRLMQPFLIPQQGPSGLEVLSALSNQDKHRVPIRANLTLHQLRLDGVKIAFENEDDIPDPPFRVRMDDTIPMEDSTVVIAFESTARMSAMQAPLEMTPIFTLEYDGQSAEVAHTINTMVQYVRIIIDTVTHGHPSERPPEDECGWKPLPL